MKKTTIFNERKLNKNCSTLCKFYLRSSAELLLFPKKSSSRDPIVRIGKTQFGFLKYICSHYFFCKIYAFFCEIFAFSISRKIRKISENFCIFRANTMRKQTKMVANFFFLFTGNPIQNWRKNKHSTPYIKLPRRRIRHEQR